MKKTVLLSVLVLVFGVSFAQTKDSLSAEEQARREKNIQAGNPFKKFGYTPKIATLSKGNYLEWHDLDTIVQVGTFMYNTRSKAIVSIIERDTLPLSEATLKPEIVSRWMSPDPLSEEYPSWSPYNFVKNNPILNIDPDGRFVLPAALVKKYHRLANYLQKGVQEIANNKTVVNALKKYGQFTDKQIKSALEWGKGPTINVVELEEGVNGAFTPNTGSDELRIDIDIVTQLENVTGEDRDAALLLVASTILHEFTHYGDDQDGIDYTEGHGEEGQAFEEASYGIDIDNLNDAKKILNEYNKRNGIDKQYSTKSNTIELEEIIIKAPKKND